MNKKQLKKHIQKKCDKTKIEVAGVKTFISFISIISIIIDVVAYVQLKQQLNGATMSSTLISFIVGLFTTILLTVAAIIALSAIIANAHCIKYLAELPDIKEEENKQKSEIEEK